MTTNNFFLLCFNLATKNIYIHQISPHVTNFMIRTRRDVAVYVSCKLGSWTAIGFTGPLLGSITLIFLLFPPGGSTNDALRPSVFFCFQSSNDICSAPACPCPSAWDCGKAGCWMEPRLAAWDCGKASGWMEPRRAAPRCISLLMFLRFSSILWNLSAS